MEKTNKLCVFLFFIIINIPINAKVENFIQKDQIKNPSLKEIENLKTDLISEKKISNEKIKLILNFLEQNKDIPLEQILENLKNDKKTNKLKKWLIKTTIAPLTVASIFYIIGIIDAKTNNEKIEKSSLYEIFVIAGLISYLSIIIDEIVMKLTKAEE